MKKSHLLLGLGISISLLTACQKQETATSSTLKQQLQLLKKQRLHQNLLLTIRYTTLFFITIKKL